MAEGTAGREDAVAGATRAPRIRVLWNPNAGYKAGLPTNRTTEPELRDVMARHGLGDDLVLTTSEEDAVAQTRRAVADGCEIVVAAGGDGTVDTVAFTLIGSGAALGILPLGSVMNIARNLDIPRDLEGAARVVADGHVRAIDVGEANGEPFLEVGSVGLNAAIFAEAQRFDRGEYRSLFHLVRAIVRYRPARLRIHLDSRVIRRRALMVAVSNGRHGGLGMTFAPRAKIDDGLFDVRVYTGFSKFELLRHLGSIVLGRRGYSPKVRTYRSRRVRIEARHPRPVRADARDLGTTPVEFRIRTRALRVVAPSSTAARERAAAP
jgi:diacylglycerol kinase (ATP)